MSEQDGAAQVTRLARQLMLATENDAGPQSAGLLGFEAGLSLAQDYGGVFPFFWDRRQPEAIASSGFRELYGLPPGCALTGAAVMGAVHPDDLAGVRAIQSDLLARGGPFEAEFRVLRPDGSIRWVLARGRTLSDERGGPCGTAGVHMDVTERKLGELALAGRDAEVAANEARLQAILNTMPQMVWSALPNGQPDFYNDRWYAYTGQARGADEGSPRRIAWTELFHSDDRSDALANWQHCLRTGEPYETEARLRRADGSYGWILARAVPVRDADGRIERWFGSSTDIDDMKIAEEQLEMVARELAHRIRNIFAVVNSLLMLSSRVNSDERAFAEAARARIDALSRAHDYIRPYAGDPSASAARLTAHGLMHSLLAPYQEAMTGHGDPGRPGRIVIAGPDLAIGATAGTSLALVIHELATNAVKHGCLSTQTGQLVIETGLEGGMAHIVWMERGGPSAAGEPERRGFGTTLSERALRVPLGAVLEREWRDEGLTARIRIPVERLGR